MPAKTLPNRATQTISPCKCDKRSRSNPDKISNWILPKNGRKNRHGNTVNDETAVKFITLRKLFPEILRCHYQKEDRKKGRDHCTDFRIIEKPNKDSRKTDTHVEDFTPDPSRVVFA